MARRNMGAWRFFFSSRRRHTRCLSDWNSDVCSSDLRVVRVEGEEIRKLLFGIPHEAVLRPDAGEQHDDVRRGGGGRRHGTHHAVTGRSDGRGEKSARSEERRVGREGRERWATRYRKK